MKEAGPVSEAASEKKRGRPERWPKSLSLGQKDSRLTRRQMLERRWAIEGVRLLMGENDKIPEEFHWLCDDKRVFKVGVLAQLGRVGDHENAVFLAREIKGKSVKEATWFLRKMRHYVDH